MPDEISRLSAEVAREPGGMASIALAEALRRERRLPAAAAAARRALERHPRLADAHDVLARIAVDGGDIHGARRAWELALSLDVDHVPSYLGLAYLAFRAGDVAGAGSALAEARRRAPDDPRVAAVAERFAEPAGQRVGGADQPSRASSPSPRPPSPADVADEEADGGLIIDRDGLVVAGAARDPMGADVSSELGAELSGLGAEAGRALVQLELGEWEGMTVESEERTLSVAPTRDEHVVVVTTPVSTPLGLARLLLGRARRRADAWLEAL